MGLEEFALKCLTYKLAEGFNEEELDEKYKFYVTEEYKVLQTVACSACTVRYATVMSHYQTVDVCCFKKT